MNFGTHETCRVMFTSVTFLSGQAAAYSDPGLPGALHQFLSGKGCSGGQQGADHSLAGKGHQAHLAQPAKGQSAVPRAAGTWKSEFPKGKRGLQHL